MIIVSDTTPINYLVLIGHVDVLESLFGRIVIPKAVFDECRHTGTPEVVRNWISLAPAWLEVKDASPSVVASIKKLGTGENETIALAVETGADAVLMDDRKAVKEARRNNLTPIGTLAILNLAAQKGLLDLSAAIKKLSATNFRLPPLDQVKKMLESAKADSDLISPA
ncbi:MAG: hypothetical protein KIT57_19340 [Blastocatellales bacterium]|nr:hypothetical protein [Blastocatellales bacterium]